MHTIAHSSLFKGVNKLVTTIYQTCRYREIRFLDFLLSKARDIDRFVETTEGIKTSRCMHQEPSPHSSPVAEQPSPRGSKRHGSYNNRRAL